MADAHSLHRQLYVLTEVAKTLTLPLEIPELLNAVIQKIIGVIEPAELGMVLLWDQPAGLLRPAAASGYDFQLLSKLALKPGEGIAGKVFQDSAGRLLGTPQEVASAMANIHPSNRAILATRWGKTARSSAAWPSQSGRASIALACWSWRPARGRRLLPPQTCPSCKPSAT